MTDAMIRAAPAHRLLAVDAARGLALVGMIVVNVGPSEASNLIERVYLLPYGRASVLFVLIAGIAMSFMLRSVARRGTRLWPVLLWRVGLLLIGGLALQLIAGAVSVILPTYALLFLAAPLLHRLGDRALLGLAAASTVIGPVVIVAAEATAGRAKLPAPGLLDSPLEALESMIVSGPYPLLIWAVPFMVGLWLGRQRLNESIVQHRIVTIGASATAVGFLVPLGLESVIGGQPQQGWGLLLTGAGHGQMPLWILSSNGSAVLLLGLLLHSWHRIGRWCAPLVAAGQLALTLYVAHLLVLAAIGGQAVTFAQGAGISAAIVLLSAIIAPIWRRWIGDGPLERIYHRPPRVAFAPKRHRLTREGGPGGPPKQRDSHQSQSGD